MQRHTRRVILTLAALVGLGLPAYAPAATLQFSAWSAPANLGSSVNSQFGEAGPAISPNGLSLYFFSASRPGGPGPEDIWVSQRASLNAPWGVPVPLGPINTTAREYVPNFSRDGHWLFFASDRPGSTGVDIWASRRENTQDDFGWQTPVNLGAGVNSAFSDIAPSYFANEDGGLPLLFSSSNRPGGLGGFDIYVSAQASDGTFGPAVLVPELSSPQNDVRPSIRYDGLEIFFYSPRPGSLGLEDLWVSTRETTLDAWATPANLGAPINSASGDFHPYLSPDGETLFFMSVDRLEGFGGSDLYMSTRTPVPEPHTILLLSSGLLGLLVWRDRQRTRRSSASEERSLSRP